MLKEFREFAMKGNVVDLAVGVIIGAAFGGIVSSLVGDIIMPVVGAITGGLDFSNYFAPLSKGGRCSTAPRKRSDFIALSLDKLWITLLLCPHAPSACSPARVSNI